VIIEHNFGISPPNTIKDVKQYKPNLQGPPGDIQVKAKKKLGAKPHNAAAADTF
jgi:hypothetical protein